MFFSWGKHHISIYTFIPTAHVKYMAVWRKPSTVQQGPATCPWPDQRLPCFANSEDSSLYTRPRLKNVLLWEHCTLRGQGRQRRERTKKVKDAFCCHLPPSALPTKLCPKPHLTNEFRDTEHRQSPWATTLTMYMHHSIESQEVVRCCCEDKTERMIHRERR